MMRSLSLWMVAVAVVGLCGCNAPETPQRTADPSEPAERTPRRRVAIPSDPASDDGRPGETTPPAPGESEVREKPAEVGVGAQGRYESLDPISVPIRAKFRAEQMIAFNIQIPSALKTYRALHGNQLPPTHEEFMREIVEKNRIQLPKLPAGETYRWDPEQGELMVLVPRE